MLIEERKNLLLNSSNISEADLEKFIQLVRADELSNILINYTRTKWKHNYIDRELVKTRYKELLKNV